MKKYCFIALFDNTTPAWNKSGKSFKLTRSLRAVLCTNVDQG